MTDVSRIAMASQVEALSLDEIELVNGGSKGSALEALGGVVIGVGLWSGNGAIIGGGCAIFAVGFVLDWNSV